MMSGLSVEHGGPNNQKQAEAVDFRGYRDIVTWFFETFRTIGTRQVL